ncbi:amidase [Ancylobacter sp. 6x-1]|uniref:Amidase n=1 Tax=Ancylobacter crimeensis TaxID=2579147 RepID=A0ABT0DDT4_9HYPH|nr:amidase [Ancylobacter crimeensis]MCK0198135.1 amidase [Ancylobacter crimeensis]
MHRHATRMDAIEIGQQIAQGKLTSREAVAQSLARIDRLDGQLHAFVLRLDERAMAMAAERDAEREAGRLRGPLHGVPVAVKDLFDIQGYRTGAGSLSYSGHRAETSATAVRLLEDAGAVIVGKTHTVEFAYGGWGTNSVLGTPWNPYDLDIHRAPGGSSSGSAVAVASGMVPLALVTDTGGSVRIPAAFCGLFGHKSTPGLIGRGGTRYLSPSHDTVGTLARSVRDLRAVAEALAGPDASDPLSSPHACDPFSSRAEEGLTSVRLATLDDPAFADLDDEVRQHFAEMLERLGSRFGPVERIAPPAPLTLMCLKAGRLMSAESYANLSAITEDSTTSVAPEIRGRINAGRDISADEIAELRWFKREWQAAFLDAFAPFDLLVMPGMPILPPPIADIDQASLVLGHFGRYVNMLDLCAASVPIALSRRGLPIGLQLIGRPFADARALSFARTLEGAGLAAFRAPDLHGLTPS